MSKYMIINGNKVEFTDEPNILAVVRKAGIDLPTFCYHPDLSTYGACRMCIVEDKWGGMVASCVTPPKDGMEIKTNTPKLYAHRKMILELLLSAHCRDCTNCEKNGHCKLQEYARRFDIKTIRFEDEIDRDCQDNTSHAIIRDPSKCILCGNCVRMCHEVQHVGAIEFAHRGPQTTVTTAFNWNLEDTDCVSCGQCSAVCPTGGIVQKSDLKPVWKELYDPKKRVVVQIAPAVRVALGEEFGLAPGDNVIGKIIGALHQIGFDHVYDTSVSADLTIMEEAAEFLDKLNRGDREMPLFTSCCPAWIRYAETKHPELLPYISTSKSPMMMFAAVFREYFREQDARDGKTTVSVAVMPCTAKKMEAAREEFIHDGVKDVDYVITTTELVKMIRQLGIQFDAIDEEAADMPFMLHSGAGVIFGTTGGVTEAAVRRVVADKSPQALREIEFIGLRGMEGTKICEIPVAEMDTTLRIAIVSGLGNAEKLIQKIRSGEERFDFVEVMACPGGCVSGAGQPPAIREIRAKRGNGLYKADKAEQIKRSEENPLMEMIYNSILKERAHELLHVHYETDKKE